MRILVDSNLLLRLANPGDPQRAGQGCQRFPNIAAMTPADVLAMP